jgi:hypothetical protein
MARSLVKAGARKQVKTCEVLGLFKVLVLFLAAAAARSVSVFIHSRSGSPKAILVKFFGHSLNLEVRK